jgi:hypothetical protein
MGKLKLILKFSLLANIVLILWVLYQRTQLDEINRNIDEGLKVVNRSLLTAKDIQQQVKEEHLRLIASNDQLGAFLQERGVHVE